MAWSGNHHQKSKINSSKSYLLVQLLEINKLNNLAGDLIEKKSVESLYIFLKTTQCNSENAFIYTHKFRS